MTISICSEAKPLRKKIILVHNEGTEVHSDHIFGICHSDFGNANCLSLTCVPFSSKYIKIVEVVSIDTLQLRKIVHMQV
jgi:hypothetical protein